jgi:hypothetical protein
MALIWADDFNSYGDDRYLLDGLYAEVDNSTGQNDDIAIVADPDTSATGKVLRFQGGFVYDNTLRWVNPGGAVATLGMGIRFYAPSLPQSDDRAFAWSFRDSDNVSHFVLEVMTTGQLRLKRGTEGGTQLGESTIPVITSNAWHHIEFKALVSNTVGTFKCYVNGNEVSGLTLTGLDNCSSAKENVAQIGMVNRLTSGSNWQTYYVKDFIVWDTLGTANNDFMGPVSVLRLFVDGDGSFNWTPSTGSTGYTLIDETGPNDADYITAAHPPPAASTFSFSNLPPDVTSVRGLISLVRAKKTDGGDGNLQVSLRSGAFDDLGANRPITTAHTYWWDVSELSPATGVAWTPAEVDAALIKVDRTL